MSWGVLALCYVIVAPLWLICELMGDGRVERAAYWPVVVVFSVVRGLIRDLVWTVRGIRDSK